MRIKGAPPVMTPPRTITGIVPKGRFESSGAPVEFANATLTGVDFGGIALAGFSALRSTFVDCRFDGIRFGRPPGLGRRGRSLYRNCSFRGVDFPRGAFIGQARFESCVFQGRINEWFSFAGEFIDCTFGGEVARSKFSGRPWGPSVEPPRVLEPMRDRNEFRGNDFTRCELRDITFVRGIDIGAQRWPSSPKYVRLDRLHLRLARAREIITRWPEPDARRIGLAMVRSFEGEEYNEQDEVFEDRRSPYLDQRVVDRFWTVMETSLDRPN
jgi:uncharacterized protein YjbI with pentapeptide repeats